MFKFGYWYQCQLIFPLSQWSPMATIFLLVASGIWRLIFFIIFEKFSVVLFLQIIILPIFSPLSSDSRYVYDWCCHTLQVLIFCSKIHIFCLILPGNFLFVIALLYDKIWFYYFYVFIDIFHFMRYVILSFNSLSMASTSPLNIYVVDNAKFLSIKSNSWISPGKVPPDSSFSYICTTISWFFKCLIIFV